MHKINQTPLIRFYSARSCVLTRGSRSVTCGRGWMAKIDSKQGRVITRPPTMISRGEIKLLCRDNNKWCAHNHRASASCRSHRHFDTHSDRRDALFYFRTRGRTRCGSLLDPASRRDCSVNAFLQPDTGQKTTRQFVESRGGGKKKKNLFQLLSNAHYSAVGFHGTRDSFKIGLIPIARCFSLNCFLYVIRKSYCVNSPR